MADQQARAIPSRASAYDRSFVALHWVLALVIGAAFVIGLDMADLPMSPLRLQLCNWHKWAGIAILALSALRLLWRASGAPPAGRCRRRCRRGSSRRARGTHWCCTRCSSPCRWRGWAYSSAAGFPVVGFGLLPLPDFVPVDKGARRRGAEAAAIRCSHSYRSPHVVLLHVGAALKHHLVDRDGLLRRMWPGRAGAACVPTR